MAARLWGRAVFVFVFGFGGVNPGSTLRERRSEWGTRIARLDFELVRTWGAALLRPYEEKPKSRHENQRYKTRE